MINREFNKAEAAALLEHMRGREREMVALTCALVEAESPSGDEEGSRVVAGLLVEAARSLEGVATVELIESPAYGVHLWLRAFPDAPDHARDPRARAARIRTCS